MKKQNIQFISTVKLSAEQNKSVRYVMQQNDYTLANLSVSKTSKPACYKTDNRYFCTDETCDWRASCKKLVADWLR